MRYLTFKKLSNTIQAVGVMLAMLSQLAQAQSFAPKYQLAPFWPNFTGFQIEAADVGVVAGQDDFGLNILSYAAISFNNTNGDRNGVSQYFLSFEPNPSGSAGNDFRAVSRYGDRYLFGGQSNGLAVTYSKSNIFGLQSPSYRNLQPSGYTSGVIEGVNLTTNNVGLVETAVGTVWDGLVSVAAWWENGAFRVLTNEPGGYAKAHGVSGSQFAVQYNYSSAIVPAYDIVGEYGTNLFAQPHACVWERDHYLAVVPSYFQRDIHPSGFLNSRAIGVGNAYFSAVSDYGTALWYVGEGLSSNGFLTHAIVWNGSSSPHDVHPAGYDSSSARATAFSYSVGFATTNSQTHAMLWVGFTPIDLHAYFPDAIDSQATGISSDGRIVGFYHIAGNTTVPFVLVPTALPPLGSPNIGSAALITSNDFNAYGLANVRFTLPHIKDSGLTSFKTTEENYPYRSVLFSRKPGGPLYPRLATEEPVDGLLISSINDYSIDGSNTIHALVQFWDYSSSGSEVEVLSNASLQLITDTGDSLPDGSTVNYLTGISSSEDGRVVIQGIDTNYQEFILMRKGNSRTMVLHSQSGYPSGTNQPNNLFQLVVGGVSTNGEILFSAYRNVYTDPVTKYIAGTSLFYWTNGLVSEILPVGGNLGGGLGLYRVQGCSMNAHGDMALIGYATNSLGEYHFGIFRRLAGSNSWEKVVLEQDFSPSGVIDVINNNFSLNNAGSILFSTIVEGKYAHLISRVGNALANYRPGQDTKGTLDLGYESFNRYEESVAVPSDSSGYHNSQIEFFCPKPELINCQPNGFGLAFDFKVSVTNRPYALLYGTNANGPWLPWGTNFNATTPLTHYVDANVSGAVFKRFFRAERIP